jgi:hypothetical protein
MGSGSIVRMIQCDGKGEAVRVYGWHRRPYMEVAKQEMQNGFRPFSISFVHPGRKQLDHNDHHKLLLFSDQRLCGISIPNPPGTHHTPTNCHTLNRKVVGS